MPFPGPKSNSRPYLTQRLELTLTRARLQLTPLWLSLCKSLIDVQRMSKPLRTARARIAAPSRTRDPKTTELVRFVTEIALARRYLQLSISEVFHAAQRHALPLPEGHIYFSYSPTSPPNWGIASYDIHVFVYPNIGVALEVLLEIAGAIKAQRSDRGTGVPYWTSPFQRKFRRYAAITTNPFTGSMASATPARTFQRGRSADGQGSRRESAFCVF